MTRIFLARQEEQKRFKEVLRSLQPNGVSQFWRRHFPTVIKYFTLLKVPTRVAVHTSPHIFLLYGEGGMGKTSLEWQFYNLAREKEFLDCFEVLQLDWQEAKDRTPALNVGHDSIRPESVLEAMYQWVSKGHEGDFERYRQVAKRREQIEEKLNKEVQSRQGDGAEYAPIVKKGLTWTLAALRKLPDVESLVGAGDGRVEAAIADVAVSALVGLIKKQLSLEERRMLATPHQQLAEALGQGLQAIAVQKPLVLLLDTYEIVDRLECDHVLRMVIKAAGERVVWTIAGRANLADSFRRGQVYFRGYRDEFSENLYVFPMSEFSREQVTEYFAHPDINVPLMKPEAEAVKEFSLGIPFVVKQIAAMRQQRVELATILTAPPMDRRNESPHAEVMRATSERFLRYCLDESEREAVYAMAMMRRPDNDLLRAILAVSDLESTMRSLNTRYSFVLLEGKGIRLHDKLESFLRDYLRAGLVGQSLTVQKLSERAVAYLKGCLQEWQREMTDTAHYFESDRVANGLLDLVQHTFWKDQDSGWRCAVPLFVESWLYDRNWQKELLGIIASFQVRFDGDGTKRLRIFTKDLGYSSFDPDSRKGLLDELETLAKRSWLDCDDRKDERMAILSLQRGRLLYQMQRYLYAYQKYLATENLVPINALAFRKELANEYREVGWELSMVNGFAIPSVEGEDAFFRATQLNENEGSNLIGLGVAQYGQGKYVEAAKNINGGIVLEGEQAYSLNWLGNVYSDQEEYELAITFYQKAINLDPKLAYPYNSLGIVYKAQQKYELAIESYQKAIHLDPKYPCPYNSLGIVYGDNENYELAIESYQRAIKLDPKYADPHNNLGNIYRTQGNYELAIKSYQQAIKLDPEDNASHNGLGLVYRTQGKYELAIKSYQQAIKLDQKCVYPHNGLGIIYRVQGNYELAITFYQQAIELNPEFPFPHNGLGNVYRAQGNYELAITFYQQAIELDQKFPYPKFNLGIVRGLQGYPTEAITLWKQGLELLDNSQFHRLIRALHEVGIGEIKRGTNSLRQILETENPPLFSLTDVLQDAELIAQFPSPLEGINTVIEMLRLAIEKAQSQ